jgi:hypothetical protein
VPLEEIAQFRALIHAGFGSTSADDARMEHSTGQPSKNSTERDTPARDRGEANSCSDPHANNCSGNPSAAGATQVESPRRSEDTQIDRNGAPQAPTSKEEPGEIRSATPGSESPKAHVAPGVHSTPAKKNAGSKNPRPTSH